MKLYHGSPKILKTIKPLQAKGIGEFENLEAVYLTTDFVKAALYAISKSLKGKTTFGIKDKKVLIVGNHKLKDGYVYEFELDKKELIKGKFKGEYAIKKKIAPYKIHKINHKEYIKNIIRLKDKKELFNRLGI